MLALLSVETPESHFPTPEELLTRSITTALRQAGLPPLQYLDVEDRDGHVYVSARLPTLLLTRGSLLLNRGTATEGV